MSNFKYKPYRNPKILKAANGEACTFCNRQDGTIVAAHSNLGADGKGVGKKADDCFVAFLCSECHMGYDHKWLGSTGVLLLPQSGFEKAMKRTWKRLLERGILK